jgi:hypothetical protein
MSKRSRRRQSPESVPVRGQLFRRGLTPALGTVVILAVVILAGAAFSAIGTSNWHAAIVVNGEAIDRAHVRSRLTLEAAFDAARDAYLRNALATGVLSASDEQSLRAAVLAEPASVEDAVSGLIDDALTRQTARAHGIVAQPDARRAIANLLASEVGPKVRWVSISRPSGSSAAPAPSLSPSSDWPRPAVGSDSADRTAAASLALLRLTSGEASAAVAQEATSAGWLATSGSGWLGGGAAIAPPASIVAAAIGGDAKPSLGLGPFDDPVSGTSSVGVVDALAPDAAPVVDVALNAHSDQGALDDWADAASLRAAVTASMQTAWSSESFAQVRAQELVVGAAPSGDTPACYLLLEHLVVRSLPSDALSRVPEPSGVEPSARQTPTPGGAGEGRPDACPRATVSSLTAASPTPTEPPASGTTLAGATSGPVAAGDVAARLDRLPVEDRRRAFDALVELANSGASDAHSRSGQMGYVTRDDVIPSLGSAAFRPGIQDGDVVGPIDTAAGPELFLVEARFFGSLDERSSGALLQAAESDDLARLAATIAPASEAARASAAGWRSIDEVSASLVALGAYRDTPIGDTSDPFVLDGQLIVIRPLERRVAPLDQAQISRLIARRERAWLGPRRAEATVTIDPDPLGEAAPSPTATIPIVPTPPAPAVPAPAGSSRGGPVLPTIKTEP